MADPAPKSNLPPRIATIVAVLTAVTALIAALNKDAIWTYFSSLHQSDVQTAQAAQKKFEDDFMAVRTSLNATPAPQPAVLRESVGDVYSEAITPDMKCRVVDVVINTRNQTLYVQIAPVQFLQDAHTFKGQCAAQLQELAKMIIEAGVMPAGATTGDTATSVAADTQTTQARVASEHVVAISTPIGAKGWMYVGRSDGNGDRIDEKTWTIKQPRAQGRVTITQALSLHSVVPDAAHNQDDHILGTIEKGAEVAVLSVKNIAEIVAPKSPPAAYTWARVQLIRRTGAVAERAFPGHRSLTRAVVRTTQAGVTGTAPCPLFPETNSLHVATQRWVYVGQKVVGSDAFIAGTSLLTTPCVPRDGAVARIAQRVKVFVGSDPHWPGVRPNGQTLIAGASVQVYGDVSGYPFDATADPSFCSRDPQPRRLDPVMLAGHQKRYCVYIPFVPI